MCSIQIISHKLYYHIAGSFLYFWGFWTSRWGNVLDLYPFTKIWWDFFWWLENMESSGLDMTWLRCFIIELKWQSLELMHCLWGVKGKWVWDLSWRQMCVLVAQSCLTLCNPKNCSLPGFSVQGFSRQDYWSRLPFPFSRGSSWPRDWTLVSCIAGRFFTIWTIRRKRNFTWFLIWKSSYMYIRFIKTEIQTQKHMLGKRS